MTKKVFLLLFVAFFVGLLLMIILPSTRALAQGQGTDTPQTQTNDNQDPNQDLPVETYLVNDSQDFANKFANYIGIFTMALLGLSGAAFVISLLLGSLKYASGGEMAVLGKQQIKRSIVFFAMLAGLDAIFGLLWVVLKTI